MKATYKINRQQGEGIETVSVDTNNLDNDSGTDWTDEMLEHYVRSVETGEISEFEITDDDRTPEEIRRDANGAKLNEVINDMYRKYHYDDETLSRDSMDASISAYVGTDDILDYTDADIEQMGRDLFESDSDYEIIDSRD